MIYNDFPNKYKCRWVACDTETYTYINNVKVADSDLIKLGKEKNIKFFRENASVKAYAWIIATNKYVAICESFEEWLNTLALMKVKYVWWYNCKFDFAQIDYQILTNNWKLAPKGRVKYDKSYKSLHNEMGGRFSLELNYEYKDINRHKHIHTIINYDFCNIFGGGLEALLKDFNIKYSKGNEVRKLKMNYQDDITQESIEYMKVDGIGLYLAVEKANEFVKQLYGLQLVDAKPDFITAGGLAKIVLLDYLYMRGDKKLNKKDFQKFHNISLEQDIEARKHSLYLGGIAFVNPKYQNKLIQATFNRYDINSMYPHKMATMPQFKGKPFRLLYDYYMNHITEYKTHEVILNITRLDARVKKGMLPLWYSHIEKEYTNIYSFDNFDTSLWIFEREFEELKNWYDIDYIEIDSVILINTCENIGYKQYVEVGYELKNNSKKEGNKIVNKFAKLMLNSSYGKLAERPFRITTERQINEETGAVHIVKVGEENNIGSILSVYQGALITAMARIDLRQKIRQIANESNKLVNESFIYCDTDSIHTFDTYINADDYKLGELKLEASCTYGKWLAPKTYFEVDKNGIVELHSKGIRVDTIREALKDNSIEELNRVFAPGIKFTCLCGMNIKGGKALIPLQKELCKEDNILLFNNDDKIELIESEMD